MSSRFKRVSTQSANFIISCLISLIAFVFMVLFARGLSNIQSTATLENLFSYNTASQTLTLFGETFPLSALTLKLFSFPSASVNFTMQIFPPMLRDFIYSTTDIFYNSLCDFVSFIIQFITR